MIVLVYDPCDSTSALRVSTEEGDLMPPNWLNSKALAAPCLSLAARIFSFKHSPPRKKLRNTLITHDEHRVKPILQKCVY